MLTPASGVLFGISHALYALFSHRDNLALAGACIGAGGTGLLVPFLFYKFRKPSWKLPDQEAQTEVTGS